MQFPRSRGVKWPRDYRGHSSDVFSGLWGCSGLRSRGVKWPRDYSGFSSDVFSGLWGCNVRGQVGSSGLGTTYCTVVTAQIC